MGQESLDGDARTRRTLEVVTDDNKLALVEDFVLKSRSSKAKQISQISGLADTSVLRILHNNLDMSKVSGGWVPKHLSVFSASVVLNVLDPFWSVVETTLKTIVAGDETGTMMHCARWNSWNGGELVKLRQNSSRSINLQKKRWWPRFFGIARACFL